MSSSAENCLNCRQSFYQQSLYALKMENFQFGGHLIPSIACFVESINNSSCSTKVCKTCLELLKDSHIAKKQNATMAQKVSAHICAVCCNVSTSNNLMNMRLTVIKFEGREIDLVECAMVYMRKTFKTDTNLMVCLACLSAIAGEYQQLAEQELKTEQPITPELPELEVKNEPPVDISDYDVRNEDAHTKSETDDDDSISRSEPPFVFDDKPTAPVDVSPEKTENVPPKKIQEANQMKSRYYCALCPSSHKHKVNLTFHMKTHRSDYVAKKFQCHHCPQWSRTKRQLRRHLQAQHFQAATVRPKFPLFQTCVICSKRFYNRNDYRLHLKSHVDFEKLQCEVCKKTFQRLVTYKRHMATQTRKFECSECGLAYHSNSSFDKHMERMHNRIYMCEMCNQPLFTRKTFQVHQLSKHGVKSKLQCKKCGEEFETHQKLTEHKSKAHAANKSFICDQCGVSFLSDSHLKKHQALHKESAIKPDCHLCNKKGFRNPDALVRHIQTAHKRATTKRTETNFACTLCPFRFVKRQHLEGHMIVHNTENRPFFQCDQCGVAYTRRQKLQIHVTKCQMSK